MQNHPLLVTLKIDNESFEYFNALRLKYFPPEKIKIGAHITLIHKLPGEEEVYIKSVIREAAGKTNAFKMQTVKLWKLGQGVAYLLDSAEAVKVQAGLRDIWWGWLNPQDKQRGFKPHITVQNRALPKQASELFHRLTAEFEPVEITALGLSLWRYLGGPWEHVEDFAFNYRPSQ